MAHGPSAPPAGAAAGSTTARGRRFSTPHQATLASAPAAANEPISSDSYLSSSPSLRTTSLLSDHTTDLRSTTTTTTTPHMNRLSSPSHERSVHSVLGSAALSTPTPRRSPSSSLPRAHDMDHHHHQQQQHDRGRTARPTTLQRVATGFRRLTRSVDVPAVSEEEDWSVFGEAMAHEIVQPQPHPQLPAPPPSPPGVVPTSHVLVSTPISDAHIDDFIPSVEGGAREVREVRVGEQDEEEEEGRSSSDTGLLASSRSSRSHSHVDSSDTESTSLLSPEDTDQQLRGGKGKGRSSSWWKRLSHLPTLPTLYRNILKCSLAYFLGSLFTYYAPLSRFISELTQDGPGEKYPSAMGHMVATV
jgi:hypothetical protein